MWKVAFDRGSADEDDEYELEQILEVSTVWNGVVMKLIRGGMMHSTSGIVRTSSVITVPTGGQECGRSA